MNQERKARRETEERRDPWDPADPRDLKATQEREAQTYVLVFSIKF